MELGRSWNRNDPGFLSQEPCERDLRRRRSLPCSDGLQQIDQGLIRFPRLRREARHDVAEIRTVERRVFVDLSREEAFAKKAEWNEPDAEGEPVPGGRLQQPRRRYDVSRKTSYKWLERCDEGSTFPIFRGAAALLVPRVLGHVRRPAQARGSWMTKSD